MAADVGRFEIIKTFSAEYLYYSSSAHRQQMRVFWMPLYKPVFHRREQLQTQHYHVTQHC